MNSILKLLLVYGLMTHVAEDSSAQSAQKIVINLPKTAMLSIAPIGGNTIVYKPQFNNEPFTETATEYWVNYSAIKGKKLNAEYQVTAAITKGNLPTGYQLMIKATGDVGKGNGAVGNPTGAIILTKDYQSLIDGIGSSYTGNSINNGHQLFIWIHRNPSVNEADILEKSDFIEISFQME